MSLFTWVDHRTLLACRFLFSAAYCVIFFGKRILYPRLNGPGTISLAFLAGLVGGLSIVARGFIPAVIYVVGGNLLIFAGFILLHRGVLEVVGEHPKTRYLWLGIILPLVLLAYHTSVNTNAGFEIVVSAVTLGFIRGYTAYELYKHATPDRPFVRVFATFMAAYCVFSFVRAITTGVLGTPANVMSQHGDLVTPAIIISTLFVAFIGPLLMLMFSGEIRTFFERESQQDTLLSILNRRGLELKLAPELARPGTRLSIALIDLDNFKTINDTEGHAAGDEALRRVARNIPPLLLERHFFGRYGGDEFLLVLPETSYTDTLALAERIRETLNSLPVFEFSLPIAVCIGITQSEPYDTIDTLLARADSALYDAKRSGRNCSRVLLGHSTTPYTAKDLSPAR